MLARGYSGREVRYELLATHYRAPLNFTFGSLDAARTALRRVDEFAARLADAAGAAKAGALPGWAQAAAERFEAAMDDDLNVSAALAALFDAIREGNAVMDAKLMASADAAAVQGLFRRWDGALGVLEKPAAAIPAEVQALLDRRQAARAAKDWKQSDALRDDIAALGWTVKDTSKGQVATKA